MAFDGTVISCLKQDLQSILTDAHISKIAQPEPDELIFTFKAAERRQIRLLISANASLPLIYLSEDNKPSPLTAPNFCMLLRKHIGSARLISVEQPEMERILLFTFEHYDEMGDLCRKKLYVEIMGKHSNIIFCDNNDMILDAIKHIPASVSSVREVLPGRNYFIPKTQDKLDPMLFVSENCTNAQDALLLFSKAVFSKPMELAKALYSSFNGFSPDLGNEICYRAEIDSSHPANDLTENEQIHLYHHFLRIMEDIREGQFSPVMYFKEEEPMAFSVLPLTMYSDYEERHYDSVSQVLATYYAAKEIYTRMRQKSVDLRKIVSTHMDRARRKLDLQAKQMKDTEKRDKYQIYGELLTAYAYQLTDGLKSAEVLNYYTNETVTIPLDETLTIHENAQKYFERYNKLKRTYEALSDLLKETQDEVDYLDTVSNSLDIARSEADLAQIKEELTEYGYIKSHIRNGKKQPRMSKSRPFHYLSSDGFDIYVGKNNLQNDELTFKLANGNDWWFHAKKMPGSHVIIKTGGREITDRAFEEAAALAGYYSKGKDSEKVEIDYLKRKDVKKPNGAKAGYVIYYTNFSMSIKPSVGGLQLIEG